MQCKLGLTGTHGSKTKRSKRWTRDRVPLAFSVEGSKARIIAESHSRRAYFSIDPLGEFIINESIGPAPARWDNRFRNCANTGASKNGLGRGERDPSWESCTRHAVLSPIHAYTQATRDWNSWNANYFNRPVDESLPSDRISIFRGKRCVIPFITKETREFFFLMGWYFEWVDRYEIMYPLLLESRNKIEWKIDEIFPCRVYQEQQLSRFVGS